MEVSEKYHDLNKKQIKKCSLVKKEKIIRFFGYVMFFRFFLLIIIDNVNSRIIQMKSSYIIVKINGIGKKNVFSGLKSPDCFPRFPSPNEVYINGVEQNSISSEYNLNLTENEIKLYWNTNVTTCNCLFAQCKDIIEIDFSHFDTT